LPEKIDNQYILRSFGDPKADEPEVIKKLSDLCLWPNFLNTTSSLSIDNDNFVYHLNNDGIYLNGVLIRSQAEILALDISGSSIAFIDSTGNIWLSNDSGQSFQDTQLTSNAISIDSGSLYFASGLNLKLYSGTPGNSSTVATIGENIDSITVRSRKTALVSSNNVYTTTDNVNFTVFSRNQSQYFLEDVSLTTDGSQWVATAHTSDPTQYFRFFTEDGVNWLRTPGYYPGVHYKSEEPLKPFENIALNSTFPC